ncbi:hypothetical protein H257_09809 [Aphanomyces astaci]|uniref:Uncharacterized protein n=1 Tax=Aphanomyces astaci TaxID=112090 RepID=W4GAM3_APHAT|nr:hypothetical protein H257_09809 [Aphanomyces astaci]ETV76346.1 hypothetical protein H257_09809 [Aphanomyces astaci]|eukprot:XP_009834471.1 hypothetical protein H257_09809 [Aphanomyces astaci]
MHSTIVFALTFVAALAAAASPPAAPETPVSKPNESPAMVSKDDKEFLLGLHRPIYLPFVAIPVLPIVPWRWWGVHCFVVGKELRKATPSPTKNGRLLLSDLVGALLRWLVALVVAGKPKN